jgi:hypothetical protein
MKMSVDGASTIFGHASWEITPPIGCSQSYRNYWLPLQIKQIAIPSLPHLQNERQQSINDCWPSIMVNHSAIWQLLPIYIVFTVIILYKAQEYLVVAL